MCCFQQQSLFYWFCVILILSSIIFYPRLAQSDAGTTVPSYERIMAKIDDLYRWNSSHARIRMSIKKPTINRTLILESWTLDRERSLVVIRKPAKERGTATLLNQNGLWNYAPRADRLIRIPPGLLQDEWMGSHFTNDDLVRETRYTDDYSGTVTRTTMNDRTLWKVDLKPYPDAPVVYSRMVFYVTPGDSLPVKTNYYDRDGIVRTLTYSKVKEVDGRKIPLKLILVPADAEGSEKTTLTYESLEFGVDISTGLFTRRGLRRVARP